MAFLFMGGEEIDFDRFINGTYMSLNTGLFRTAFARTAVSVPSSANDSVSYAAGSFTGPSSDFWFSSRVWFIVDEMPTTYRTMLAFFDGTTKRVALQFAQSRKAQFVVYDNSGGATVLLESANPVLSTTSGLLKIDLQVTYSNPGRIRLFVNGVPALDYTGNTLVGGSTTLNKFNLYAVNERGGLGTNYSEVMIADRDTRTLSLKTHTPVATAPGHNWIGSVSDVSEVTLDESTMLTTDALDATAKFTIDSLPTGNFAVRGVKVSTWAARGGTGPANIAVGVNVGGTDNYGPDRPLDTGYGPINRIMDQNPVANRGWSPQDIASLQIVAKSKY